MASSKKLTQRIMMTTAISLSAIACSPINAKTPDYTSSVAYDADTKTAQDKQLVKIVSHDKMKWKSEDGKKYVMIMGDEYEAGLVAHDFVMADDVHRKGNRTIVIRNDDGTTHEIKIRRIHKNGAATIEVEGGTLVTDDAGNKSVIYSDNKGKKYKFEVAPPKKEFLIHERGEGREHGKMRHTRKVYKFRGDGEEHVWVSEPGEIRKDIHVKMKHAHTKIEKAKEEMQNALKEIEKEMASVEDKKSVEYTALEAAKQAIVSAMGSLKNKPFDEKKVRIEMREMREIDNELRETLRENLEDVHEQRKIIIDLRDDLHEEVGEARAEIHEMLEKIEEMDDGEAREVRLKAVKEMEKTMGEMAEIRLKALKKAEEELQQARLKLEKEIAENKVADQKENKK